MAKAQINFGEVGGGGGKYEIVQLTSGSTKSYTLDNGITFASMSYNFSSTQRNAAKFKDENGNIQTVTDYSTIISSGGMTLSADGKTVTFKNFHSTTLTFAFCIG